MSQSVSTILFSTRMQHTDVLVPFFCPPGFAIPLFRPTEFSNSLYHQIADNKGRIEGFTPFNIDTASRRIDCSRFYELGDRELYSVVNPSGDIISGDEDFIIYRTKEWMNEIKDDFIRMNFQLFAGEIDSGAKSLSKYISNINSEQKNSAIKFSIVSVLQSYFLPRILRSSEYVSFNSTDIPSIRIINKHDQINVYLTSIFPIDDNSSSHHIGQAASFFRSAMHTPVVFISNRSPSFDYANILSSEELLSTIYSIRRQEDRISKFIRYILHSEMYPTENLLKLYESPTRWESNVISLLRRNLSSNSSYSEIEIAKILFDIVREAVPFNRGRIILSLAKELNDYPIIRSALKNIVGSRYGFSIDKYRDDVMHILTN